MPAISQPVTTFVVRSKANPDGIHFSTALDSSRLRTDVGFLNVLSVRTGFDSIDRAGDENGKHGLARFRARAARPSGDRIVPPELRRFLAGGDAQRCLRLHHCLDVGAL